MRWKAALDADDSLDGRPSCCGRTRSSSSSRHGGSPAGIALRAARRERRHRRAAGSDPARRAVLPRLRCAAAVCQLPG